MGWLCWQHPGWCSLILTRMHRVYRFTSSQPRTRHNCSAKRRNQRSRFRLWARIRDEEPEAATPNGRGVASIDFMLDWSQEALDQEPALVTLPQCGMFLSLMIRQQVHLQPPCYDFCPVQATAIKLVFTGRKTRRSPTSDPQVSRNGSVPGSDGRCVQRAGT